MTQVFPGTGEKFTPFVAIHGGFRRLYIVSGAGFDLDEAQHVLVPTDQVDPAATISVRKLRATMMFPRLRR